MNENKVDFFKFIKNNSSELFKMYLKIDHISLQECDPNLLKYRDYVSLIRLTGNNIRVKFKAYYYLSDAANFSHNLYKLAPEKLNTNQSLDSMKEFCNQSAGIMKNILCYNGIPVSHGIPFSTRAYHDIFLNKNTLTSSETFWTLTDGKENYVDFSLSYYSKNEETKESLKLLTPPPKDSEYLSVEIF